MPQSPYLSSSLAPRYCFPLFLSPAHHPLSFFRETSFPACKIALFFFPPSRSKEDCCLYSSALSRFVPKPSKICLSNPLVGCHFSVSSYFLLSTADHKLSTVFFSFLPLAGMSSMIKVFHLLPSRPAFIGSHCAIFRPLFVFSSPTPLHWLKPYYPFRTDLCSNVKLSFPIVLLSSSCGGMLIFSYFFSFVFPHFSLPSFPTFIRRSLLAAIRNVCTCIP